MKASFKLRSRAFHTSTRTAYKPEKYPRVERHYFSDEKPLSYNEASVRENCRKEFDSFAHKHGIQLQSDWYNFGLTESYKDKRLWKVITDHGESLVTALAWVYNEFTWYPWLSSTCPKGYWSSLSNQLKYMDWLEEELEIHKLEDWYKYGTSDIENKAGSRLLYTYNMSQLALLKTLRPQHEWLPWLLPAVPRGFWMEIKNQRRYLNWLADEFKIETTDGWYSLKPADVEATKGTSLLAAYGGSLAIAVESVFPELRVYPWLFGSVRGSWSEPETRKKYCDWLAEKLNIQTQSDWYKITRKDVEAHHGVGLMQYNQDPLTFFLSEVYPQYVWCPWLFPSTPQGFWDDINNQYKYMEWLAEELGVTQPQDWYNIKYAAFAERGGAGLLNKYSTSVSRAIAALYPHYEVKIKKLSSGHWMDIRNQRKYMDWLADEIGVESLRDWYRVKSADITSRGGSALLRDIYQGSIYKLFYNIYPEINWMPWLFSRLPSYHWDDKERVQQFMEWASERLNIKEIDEWNSITWDQFAELGGASLATKHGGMKQFLQYYYPDHDWAPLEHKSVKKQRFLLAVVKEVFKSRQSSNSQLKKMIRKPPRKKTVQKYQQTINVDFG